MLLLAQGERTVHPDIIEYAQHISEKIHKKMITVASREDNRFAEVGLGAGWKGLNFHYIYIYSYKSKYANSNYSEMNF